MTHAQSLEAGGLWLAVESGPDGPRLKTDRHETAPLAAVLNAAVSGALPGLEEALERGDGVATPVDGAVRPHPGDEFPAERARWQRLTGEDPGDDVYVVVAVYAGGTMIVPRAALLAGLRALRRLREGADSP